MSVPVVNPTSKDLAAVVLAAGSGTRLRPLTEYLPKALCPIANRPLVDYATQRAVENVGDVLVNAWHMSDQMQRHFEENHHESEVHFVVEEVPLGTAGTLGANKDWISGRGVFVQNADAWHTSQLDDFVDGWDGERVRLLVQSDAKRGDFGDKRFCGASIMPWSRVEQLPSEPSGLWEAMWRDLSPRDIDFVELPGPYFDCGTPADYLDANMTASRGESVVGAGAKIEGEIDRCVIWPDAVVPAGESLSECVRIANGITVDASRHHHLALRPKTSPGISLQ